MSNDDWWDRLYGAGHDTTTHDTTRRETPRHVGRTITLKRRPEGPKPLDELATETSKPRTRRHVHNGKNRTTRRREIRKNAPEDTPGEPDTAPHNADADDKADAAESDTRPTKWERLDPVRLTDKAVAAWERRNKGRAIKAGSRAVSAGTRHAWDATKTQVAGRKPDLKGLIYTCTAAGAGLYLGVTGRIQDIAVEARAEAGEGYYVLVGVVLLLAVSVDAASSSHILPIRWCGRVIWISTLIALFTA